MEAVSIGPDRDIVCVDPRFTLDAAATFAGCLRDMSEHYASGGIPEEFWSEYTEQAFEACIDCERPLDEGLVPYAIQKHVVAGETVFEMAICVECAMRMQTGFSVESRQALVEFVRAAPERRRRQEEAAAEEDTETSPEESSAAQFERIRRRESIRRERALACCALCAKPRTDCHRYSLGTACLGASILTAAPETDNLGSPFLICEDCEMQLNECISRQTRDAWDRFLDEHFDGPPALSVDPQELVAIF